MAKLNPIFSSGMVLQAGKPARIFGTGEGHISISFLGATKSVDADGKWLIEFDAQNYGGPYTMNIDLNGEQITIEDIHFGDVYLLGGQSNMQFKMWERRESTDVYEGNENVRLFTVDRMEENTDEKFGMADGWVGLTKENAKDFSAIGYYVASEWQRIEK